MTEKEKIVFRLIRNKQITDKEAATLLKEEVRIEYYPSYPYYQQPLYINPSWWNPIIGLPGNCELTANTMECN